MSQKGTLCVKLIDAYLTRDTEYFGKMDPFVEFKINNKKESILRSSTHDNGGKLPSWNEKFYFRCNLGDTLSFIVYDEETGDKNDLVGTGSLQIKGETQSLALALYYKEESVGNLKMEVGFIGDGVAQPNMYKQQMKEEQKAAHQEQQRQESLRQMAIAKQREKEKAQQNRGSFLGLGSNNEKDNTPDIQEEVNKLREQEVKLTESNQDIIVESQRVMHSKGNFDLQTHILNETMEYNELKQEVISKKMQNVRGGVYKGHLIVSRVEVNIKGVQINKDMKVQMEVGMNESGVNVNRMTLGPVGVEQRVKAIFPEQVNFPLTKGNILLLQAYDQLYNLIGFGSLSLAVLNDNCSTFQIPLYNANTLRAICTCQVEYQESSI